MRAAIRSSETDVQELALEVIGNLPLPELAPDLLKLPPRTVSGTLYHTLNSLMTGDQKAAIGKAYFSRLLARPDGAIGAADAVHILSGLRAAGMAFPAPDLAALVKDPVPQVREAVVEYAAALTTEKDMQYRSLIRTALVSPMDSDRFGAYRVIAAMPKAVRKAGFKDAYEACLKDEVQAIRKLCPEVAP